MAAPDPLLEERAGRIRLLAMDVDGVLTDGRLYFDSEGRESKAFHTRDGFGLRALQDCGIERALITGRSSAMVTERAAQLGIEHVYQGRRDKLEAYLDLLENTGLDAAQVCFIGDDWLDLAVLARVGLAVAVRDADEEVRDRVHYVTRCPGGHGAVREVCNLILRAQGHDRALLERMLAP